MNGTEAEKRGREFSFILPVYNAEEYLEEAVGSILGQKDYDLSKLEILLVDDGSADGSGALCDRLAAEHPGMIHAFHQENEGVSSARNRGIRGASGEFLCFLDADDKISENACAAVSAFLREYGEQTDAAAIPIEYFDAKTGSDPANGKFRQGTRVIDLNAEPETVQESCCCFVRRETLGENGLYFDERLKSSEDAKFIQRVLWKKMTLGVVCGAVYFHRYGKTGWSAKTPLELRAAERQWWFDTLRLFFLDTLEEARKECGCVPEFVQNSLAYSLLNGIFRLKDFDRRVLSEEDITEILSLCGQILGSIDDRYIVNQKGVFSGYKIRAMACRYGRDALRYDPESGCILCGETVIADITKEKTLLDYLRLEDGCLRAEGSNRYFCGGSGSVVPAYRVNGKQFVCGDFREFGDLEIHSLGEKAGFVQDFRFEVRLDGLENPVKIEIGCMADGVWHAREKLSFGDFSALNGFAESFYTGCGRVLQQKKGVLLLSKSKGRLQTAVKEIRYLRGLAQRKLPVPETAANRIRVRLESALRRRPLWIVSDRISRADDNGEAFFRFLRQEKKDEVDAVFAISGDSPDAERLKAVGPVVEFGSEEHGRLMLQAQYILSSQGGNAHFVPFMGRHEEMYRDLARAKFVFLQHGVIMNDLSAMFRRQKKHFSAFVTTTRPEYEYIRNGAYGYTEEVLLTGCPRYDRLEDHTQKLIVIMPTWRASLVSSEDRETGKRTVLPGFEKSTYYRMYAGLFTDTALFDEAEKLGYRIAYRIHPCMTATEGMLPADPRLEILPQTVPYSRIFETAALLITDYSSVNFDFAYLRKPVLYYQEDYAEFFSGAHTVSQGYFRYDRDGFGEVCRSKTELADRIREYLGTGCALKEQYRNRIDETFPYHDRKSCERLYEELRKRSR